MQDCVAGESSTGEYAVNTQPPRARDRNFMRRPAGAVGPESIIPLVPSFRVVTECGGERNERREKFGGMN